MAKDTYWNLEFWVKLGSYPNKIQFYTCLETIGETNPFFFFLFLWNYTLKILLKPTVSKYGFKYVLKSHFQNMLLKFLKPYIKMWFKFFLEIIIIKDKIREVKMLF